MLLSLQGRVLPSPSTPGWNGFHLLSAAARASVHPPRRSFLLANSRLFSGWRENNWKSLPGQGNQKRWEESEEPGGVRSVPRAMPSASDAGGRPGEGKPCFSTPALLRRGPVCTHSGVGVNHRPRGRAGQCAARGRRRGRGLVPSTPTLAKVRGHQALTANPSTTPRLDRPGTGVILVSFLPLVGCVPFRGGTSQATRGSHSFSGWGFDLSLDW